MESLSQCRLILKSNSSSSKHESSKERRRGGRGIGSLWGAPAAPLEETRPLRPRHFSTSLSGEEIYNPGVLVACSKLVIPENRVLSTASFAIYLCASNAGTRWQARGGLREHLYSLAERRKKAWGLKSSFLFAFVLRLIKGRPVWESRHSQQ